MRNYLSLFLLIVFLASCGPQTPPDPSSEEYRDAVSAFYLSLAAIEADQAIFAVEKMNQLAEWYPREPAAWGNLGVFAMRQGNFELAGEHLNKARELAPQNADIEFLLGILESRRGNIESSIDHLEKAAKLSPEDPRILYALVSELERQDAVENAARIEDYLDRLFEQEQDNLAVLMEMTRLAAKLENRELLNEALNGLADKSEDWPVEIRNQFNNLKQDILDKPIQDLTFEMAYLRNNLNELPKFQRDFDKIQLPPNQVGFLLTEFMWLPEASNRNAPLDEGLAFDDQNVESLGEENRVVRYISLSSDENIPKLIGIRGGEAVFRSGYTLPFPSSGKEEIQPRAIETLDYNYDFLNDLVFVGMNGFMLYEQAADSTFSDVTPLLDLPSDITGDSYSGVWTADIDVDGDLDLILTKSGGGVLVLGNNGDDTFSTVQLFEALNRPIDFFWSDMDSDGDADAVFLEEDGSLAIYQNERAGNFGRVAVLPEIGEVSAIEIADLNEDTYLDLLTVSDSSVHRIFYDTGLKSWEARNIVTLDDTDSGPYNRLFASDFDNNGGIDLLASGTSASRIWLSDETGSLRMLDGVSLSGSIASVADVTGDNRLDLLSLNGNGQPVEHINNGTRDYNGLIIRPRASGSVGDRRINAFGLGGEIEIRSGRLYQKKPITSPAIHFGLADYEEAEMLRVIWPNGSVQAEFAELGFGSQIFNEQMLKGSCPWVFAHNGEEMEFVTDFIWRTALGLRINAQGGASVIHSIDWIKIAEDQLQPQNGYYDIRITAELWETHFFDHVSLKVVDHPSNMEVMIDERFFLPAPEQKLYPVSRIRPVKRALDHHGKDVTGLVRDKDGKYVDTFSLTSYQGLAEEHYLEIDLGDDLPDDRPVWLVAYGWVYPTDSSINVAISQGSQPAPHGIFLQVPDGQGDWKTVRDDIGFPAGKNKTVLINLSDLPTGELPERIRLTTNMEIYWDQITWTTGKEDADLKVQNLQPEVADLRYRGFSELDQKARFKPTVPDYQNIAGTTPKWIDLIGYYTRFGDVRELLKDIDDRYVIMNAGDELAFRFKALSPPPEGWERDFVLVGDGWVKDGDYNTGFSKTVIPLPYHGMEDYSEAPDRLENDPVYQKHKEDWIRFHTRFITPKEFRTALIFDN